MKETKKERTGAATHLKKLNKMLLCFGRSVFSQILWMTFFAVLQEPSSYPYLQY